MVDTFRSPDPQHGILTGIPEADQSLLQRIVIAFCSQRRFMSTLLPVGNDVGAHRLAKELLPQAVSGCRVASDREVEMPP